MTVAVALQGLGLGLGLVSMLFSIRPFALGVWTQSEPVVIAVHLGAGLCWAGLALPAVREYAAARLRSWPAAPILALAAWSAVTALPAEYPLLSLLGSPQTAEGALWYLDLVAYILAAAVLRERGPAQFDMLTGVAAAVVAAAALCDLPLSLGLPKVFSFGKFLGPCALALFPLAWERRTRGGRGWAPILAAAVFAVIASGNRSVLPGLVMALPVLFPNVIASRRISLPWMIAATAAALALPYVLLRHTDWFDGVFSLWSRSILTGAVDRHVLSGLRTALFGHGWGGFQEALARHVVETGVSMTDGRWTDLTRDQFHSHNALVEAAYAVGLPGAVLAAMVRAGFALGAAPRAVGIAVPFALCLAFHDSLWFTMPFAAAFLGVAAAALGSGAEVPARRAGGEVFAVPALCSLVAATALFVQAWESGALRHCLTARPGRAACAALPHAGDLRGQELDTAVLLNAALGRRPARRDAAMVVALVRAKAAEAPERPHSALLSVSLVNAFAGADSAPETSPFGPMTDADEELWRGELLRLLRTAPSRLDLAAPYLNRLVRLGRDGEDDPVRAVLEREHPDHPVTLWFEGLRRMAGAEPERRRQGMELLRRALDGGVERIVVIPAEVVRALRAAGGSS